MKLTAATLFAFSIALTTAACGTENQAATDSSSAVSGVTPPSDASVPVVAGPKPKTSASPEPTGESVSADGTKTCGATKGPDGALYIHIVDGDLSCDTAKTIAKEYGPLIATGAPQTVSGWDCGPSDTAGELARCTKGSQAFALMVQ